MMTFERGTKPRVPLFRVCVDKMPSFVLVSKGITHGRAFGSWARFVRVWLNHTQYTLYYSRKKV